MLNLSKIHLNITYHPILENYEEFKNVSKISDQSQLSIPKWREAIGRMISGGKWQIK